MLTPLAGRRGGDTEKIGATEYMPRTINVMTWSIAMILYRRRRHFLCFLAAASRVGDAFGRNTHQRLSPSKSSRRNAQIHTTTYDRCWVMGPPPRPPGGAYSRFAAPIPAKPAPLINRVKHSPEESWTRGIFPIINRQQRTCGCLSQRGTWGKMATIFFFLSHKFFLLSAYPMKGRRAAVRAASGSARWGGDHSPLS